jgi:NAD(P)-dependent dehydrogenase (short-subunit alcohol dehydrogenase family)
VRAPNDRIDDVKRLHNKVVVVTGAAGGLGRATALAMAREGARLALVDIDGAGLGETHKLVQSFDTQAVMLQGDVTEQDTHERLCEKTVAAFGGVHGLCNVAGILSPGTLGDVTAAQFDRVMHVNCLAHLLAIRTFAPRLREAGGSIVNVASVGAQVGLPLMSVYCASKAAVVGMTRAVAIELSPHVRCNAVCPGGIDTPMAQGLLASVPAHERELLLSKLTGRQLLQRFATPEEIAHVLAFLVSDESAFMTGSVVSADGGHTAW